jgi:hypothetical protein
MKERFDAFFSLNSTRALSTSKDQRAAPAASAASSQNDSEPSILNMPAISCLPSSSSSSSGYTVAGLPVLTFLQMDHYSNRAKCYIPYMQLGYLEINNELIDKICPCDLEGISCPFDEIFAWDWVEACWKRGNCGMLRLCKVRLDSARSGSSVSSLLLPDLC